MTDSLVSPSGAAPLSRAPAARPLLWLLPLQALMLLHLLVYVSGPGKLESRALLALAGLVAVCALAVSGLALLPLTTWARPWLRRHVGWGVAGLAGVVFAFGVVSRPELIYAHIALNLALVGGGIARALDLDGWRDALRLPRWAWWIAGAAVLAVIVVRLLGLSYAPDINIADEPWVLGWAVGFLREGRSTDYLMYFGGMNAQYYYAPMAAWLSVFGVGLWQARLFSFVVTLLVALVGGLAAGRLYGRAAGWVAALLLFASAHFFTIAPRIRHDAGLALAVALALWLYAEGLKRDRRLWHGLAGLMIGLGWFAHYHATIFGVGLVVGLYVPRWLAGRGWRRALDGAAFGVGGLIGGVVVFIVQVAPHILLTGGNVARSPTAELDILTLLWSALGYPGIIAPNSPIEAGLIAAALLLALWRRRLTDISLALSLYVCHVGLMWVHSDAFQHFAVQLMPLYMLLLAGIIVPSGQAPNESTGALSSQGSLTRGTAMMSGMILLALLGWSLRMPLHHLSAGAPVQMPAPPPARWIIEHVATDSMIAGDHYYYLWLTDYRFVSSSTAALLPAAEQTRLPTREAVWDEISPEVYIFDLNLEIGRAHHWMLDTGYLESRGYELVAQFEGQSQPIMIYRKIS